MIPSAKEFYAARIENLATLKAKGDPTYTENFATFLELVFADVEFTAKLNASANKIHLISGRLIQVDEGVKLKVKSIYEDLPNSILGDTKLKGRLYEASALMFWNENNRHVKESCKYMFVQLEMMCEYLIIKFDIILWAIQINNKAVTSGKKEPYKIEYFPDGKPKYLQTGMKIQTVCDFLIQEKGATLLAGNIIRDIKEMRDFSSHGYHQSTVNQKQAYFDRVSNNFDHYIQNWVIMLKEVKEFLRD